MPQYFFNIRNGRPRDDNVGIRLEGIRAARLEAIQRLGHLMSDSPGEFDVGHDWRMEVTDDSGLMLFRVDLDLLLVTSPSVSET